MSVGDILGGLYLISREVLSPKGETYLFGLAVAEGIVELWLAIVLGLA